MTRPGSRSGGYLPGRDPDEPERAASLLRRTQDSEVIAREFRHPQGKRRALHGRDLTQRLIPPREVECARPAKSPRLLGVKADTVTMNLGLESSAMRQSEREAVYRLPDFESTLPSGGTIAPHAGQNPVIADARKR